MHTKNDRDAEEHKTSQICYCAQYFYYCAQVFLYCEQKSLLCKFLFSTVQKSITIRDLGISENLERGSEHPVEIFFCAIFSAIRFRHLGRFFGISANLCCHPVFHSFQMYFCCLMNFVRLLCKIV